MGKVSKQKCLMLHAGEKMGRFLVLYVVFNMVQVLQVAEKGREDL